MRAIELPRNVKDSVEVLLFQLETADSDILISTAGEKTIIEWIAPQQLAMFIYVGFRKCLLQPLEQFCRSRERLEVDGVTASENIGTNIFPKRMFWRKPDFDFGAWAPEHYSMHARSR